MATDIQTELEQAGREPLQASDDGGSVRARSAADMITADEYGEGTRVAKLKSRGFIVGKFKPPGCQ